VLQDAKLADTTAVTWPKEKSSVMLQSTPWRCSFLQASTPAQVEASLM
jgi:hypothetical protein